MPQPVDAWQWRKVLLSPHGPRKQNARLVAFAVARDVGGTQVDAYPSQKTIAANAQVSLRTAQRLLAELETDDWLVRGRGPKTDQGWALTLYQFTVPDHVEQFVPEHPWESDPTWERGDKAVSPAVSNGGDTIVSLRRGDGDEGGDIGYTKVATTGAKGDDKNAEGDDTWVAHKDLSKDLRRTLRGDGALARTDGALRGAKKKAEEVWQEAPCEPSASVDIPALISGLKSTLKKRAALS
jgi:hypothetical protein